MCSHDSFARVQHAGPEVFPEAQAAGDPHGLCDHDPPQPGHDHLEPGDRLLEHELACSLVRGSEQVDGFDRHQADGDPQGRARAMQAAERRTSSRVSRVQTAEAIQPSKEEAND